MIVHNKEVVAGGSSLKDAKKALILLHGRGARADGFIQITNELDDLPDFVFLAIQAIHNTWYPHSFMAPVAQNQPQLDASLDGIAEVVRNLGEVDIKPKDIYFMGFSQGACLTLEYVAQNAQKYGGVVALTGGLIGQHLDLAKYSGNFEKTPIFIGSSDFDPHVPESRIEESVKILNDMNANVVKKIYKDMGHTINQDEMNMANLIFNDTL